METDSKTVLKVCGEKCEIYSRVCGYLRPVQQWNRGRKAEYALRREFKPMTEQEAEEYVAKRFGAF
jgi:ribonucleoside-triphosphate reductase